MRSLDIDRSFALWLESTCLGYPTGPAGTWFEVCDGGRGSLRHSMFTYEALNVTANTPGFGGWVSYLKTAINNSYGHCMLGEFHFQRRGHQYLQVSSL